ncbi:MAG TPA: exopolysaccharide biosynthesis protein [Gammaproteobacteria bacterium]|nr:exopolysaccharide biosynthesis protein [Gammaproteobacteria bacterium]
MTSKNLEASSLGELLDQIESAASDSDQVSLDTVMSAVGRRSFGPILVLVGLIILAPVVGDIPGVPTIMALLLILTAGQVLMRRKHLWLPRWMLERRVSSEKLDKVTQWLRKPARFIDGLLRQRLQRLTDEFGIQVTAVLCIVIAAALPPMELVPFSANVAGIALTALGLALIANDGLLAIGAAVVSVGAIGLVVYTVFF